MTADEQRCSRFAILPESIRPRATPLNCVVYRVRARTRGREVLDSLRVARARLGTRNLGYTNSLIDTVGAVHELFLQLPKSTFQNGVSGTAWVPLHLTVVVLYSRPVTIGVVSEHPLDRRNVGAVLSKALVAQFEVIGGSVAYGGLEVP